jgi:glycosyltransferase involved in cell wall biosynthesis
VRSGTAAVPDIEPGSVRFATICDDEHGFTRSFLMSFLPLLAADLGGQQRIWRGGYSIQGATSSGVVEGRNEVVREFLGSHAEWLFFIDSDMGFEPDALERLLEAADPVERPIVGGLCFGYTPVADVLGSGNALVKKPFPTIFDLHETDDDIGFRPRWGYVPGAVQQCAATGAALLLIHRSVLEAIDDKWGHVWFDRMKHPQAKKLWGEDTSFCMRSAMLGYPVFVHAGVRSSHSKVIMVTQEFYMGELAAEPATDEVAVIVPVLKRPQNAAPFMRSLRASTGLATVYAVANPDDTATIEAWDAAGAQVLLTDGVSFAKKVNHGYRNTEQPWVFIVGDDVKFHPGWLDHAQNVARITDAEVIGTNDLGNARVVSGEHATHMLIARDYIDKVGASWDGPGVVCHEGYRHWYVDDELVTASKQRGVWAPALAAVVEHLHPLWGKAENDKVYDFGQTHAQQDMKLFRKRLAEYSEVAA